MQFLLSHDAFVDCLDGYHRTPLHIAARKENINAIRLLINHNADPLIFTDGKKLPINLAKSADCKFILRRYMTQIYTKKFQGIID